MTIEHSDSELREEMAITRLDGREERITFQCRTDGTENQIRLNGKPIRGTVGWEGKELLIESWLQIGTTEMHFRDFWSLSPDGQTLSMEHRDDTLAGQLTVLERVG